MTRQEILDQVHDSFGLVPDWLTAMSDEALHRYWTTLKWILSDSKLGTRDKILIAFGAASALHCGH